MIYRIFKDRDPLERIVADLAFVEPYCVENGYTWEEEPELEPPSEPEPAADEILGILLGLIG